VPIRGATALFALAALTSVAFGQYIAYPYQPLPNIPYDGRFTFVRVRYDPAPGGYWPGRRPFAIFYQSFALATARRVASSRQVAFETGRNG
jgi:hypothetical protein